MQKVSQNTELLVYQGTNFNQTSDQADVVLPAAAWPEKEGTFTNYAGRVQKINEAFAPPGRAWPDGKIFVELASRLGAPFRYICA
ncbi:MAG: molybdopterin-dependent oxidoreductase, partial [Dehalococcoidales bacterium]